ncbi:unnamed protein product [Staurois parvus]|uniref:Uncharacterized protein n=1 Tax=Staurois parvus TaxID=386267 RepID=A0ABN9BQ60_9NEOB|nr:unnamed protein product [Staurois parvus]
MHTALHRCAQHSHTSSVLTVKHKHTQHTVNSLIAPILTPSCPVPLVQCQCFFLALITVLVSLGMSVTPSQSPPQCQNARQSPTKSC